MTTTNAPPFQDEHKRIVIIVAAIVSAMGFIDATALNVALPFIQSSLRASATDIHWVLEIYLLFLAALMMAGGALGDSFGRRRLLRWGITGFGIASLGCAFSDSAESLILFRALQGTASAVMIPASLALLNASFPPAMRGPAIGKWSALVALVIPLGPLLGGIAVDFFSWHFVFLLNVPFCLFTLYSLRGLPRPPYEPKNRLPLDLVGSLMITGALALITYALLEAGREGAFAIHELGLLVLGLMVLVGFFGVERVIANPMLPPFLLKDRRFILVSAQTLVLFAGFQSAMYFLSFLYIQSFDYSALEAGAASLPISIIVALISARAGRFSSKHGPRAILCLASLVMAGALFWLSFASPDYWRSVLPGMIMMGISVGLFAAPLTTVAMAAAGPGRDGLASGVNNAASRIGPLLGIALFGYWIGGDYTAHLFETLAHSSLAAEQKTYLLEHRTMLAAVPIPSSWPDAVQSQTSDMVKTLFALSVQDVLRFSAGFALLSAVLALFYRASDCR